MNVTIIDCFDTWEHRVDLLQKIYAEAGHSVQVLMSDFCHVRKSRRLEHKNGFKFFTAEPYDRNLSAKRLHSHIQLSHNIFRWVEEHERDIDLLWVLAPPNSFVKDAAEVKKRHPHFKLIIDLIDLWPETMPIGRLKKFPAFHAWKALRDDNLKYADVVVVECNHYKHILRKNLNHVKMKTLYLAREDQGYEPDLNLPEDKIALCYLGSINNIIDIPAIEKIIRIINVQKSVLLHIIGDGERRAELIDGAKAAGADVVFHGLVYDREIKKKIFDSCHYGLNIMKDSVCVGLTMKSIDYFEFGLPIINNIRGDTWEVVKKYRCGVNFNYKDRFFKFALDSKYRNNSRKFFESHLTEEIFKSNLIRNIIEI